METMQDLMPHTLKKLSDLIRVNLDSAAGFRAAAQRVDDPRLAALFESLAQQRGLFAEQLRGFVEMSDAEARDAASVTGPFHRWWLKLRDTLSGGEAYAILAEAERGEDVIKQRYEKALEQTPGSPVHPTLQRQYRDVKQVHGHIRDLRDVKKPD